MKQRELTVPFPLFAIKKPFGLSEPRVCPLRHERCQPYARVLRTCGSWRVWVGKDSMTGSSRPRGLPAPHMMAQTVKSKTKSSGSSMQTFLDYWVVRPANEQWIMQVCGEERLITHAAVEQEHKWLRTSR